MATLAAVAAAGPVAAKQRIEIQVKGGFVLTPLTPGDIKPDAGTARFCCWTERHIMRDGQAIDINNPQMTLTGKHGTSSPETRSGSSTSRTDWPSSRAPGKSSVAPATTPGFPEADAAPASICGGSTKAQFEGFLSPR